MAASRTYLASGANSRPGAGEFRRGWTLLVAATVGVGLGLSPIPFYELGLMAPELAREFSWPIATVMGGVFFMMVGSLIMSPMVGALADRFGVRVVTLTSIVCFSLSLALFALQTGSVAFYYATWLLMAISGAGTLPITWTRSVNRSFDIHKGLALGVTLSATGLSGFLLKPATAGIISEHGWRAGFIFLALLPLLIAWPLAWRFFHPVPAAPRPAELATSTVEGVAEGHTLRQALRDWRFWGIGLGISPVAFAIAGPIPNLEMILKTNGVSREVILGTVPFLGLAVIGGRLGGGWLVDRFWAPGVALVLLSASALAVWSLTLQGSPAWLVLLGVAGVGIAAGVEFDLMAFMTARYFGTLHYGAIYGSLYAFFSLGSGIAPFIYGRAYDQTRSFDGVVTLSALLIMAGAFTMLTLGRYRFAPRRTR